MASANVSIQSFFINFGLIATLLLQLHGLLYVYITYRHHVNKRLSIYYAVKRTIAQKFNPRCRANSAKSNCTRISNPLNRIVPVCSNRDPVKAGWPDCHVIKMLKNKLYIYEAGSANSPHVIGPYKEMTFFVVIPLSPAFEVVESSNDIIGH